MLMLTQGCCKHGHRCHTPCSLNPELLTLLQGRGLCGRHCNGVAPAIGRGPVMLTGQQEASYSKWTADSQKFLAVWSL